MESVGPSWVWQMVALTGWRGDARPVRWEAVERELGLRLPRDYKLMAEVFGAGTSDGSLDLWAPGSRHPAPSLTVADRAEFAGPLPPGGSGIRLLQWAATSAGHSFCWAVEDPDPERRPVFARADSWDPWERFDCSSAEFVHGMLTDPRHPYSLARSFGNHWFTSAVQVEEAEEAFWDDCHPAALTALRLDPCSGPAACELPPGDGSPLGLSACGGCAACAPSEWRRRRRR